ncbi:MAG: hypothetical protein ACKVQA_15015 [Burkholderiales bacterium]
MKSSSHRHVAQAITLSVALGFALNPCWAAVGPGSPFQKFKLVSKKSLAKQRGGFVGAEGLRLQINLNLRQMVYVNNVRVHFVETDLSNLGTATHAQLNQMRADLQAQGEVIKAEARALAAQLDGLSSSNYSKGQAAPDAGSARRTGGSDVAGEAPLPKTTSVAASSRQDAQAAASADSASSSSLPGPASNATVNGKTTVTSVTASPDNPTSRITLIQNGPRNIVDMKALQNFRGGTLTIMQNTLDNQIIRHEITIDATLSGMRNMRTLNTLGSLNLQLRGIGR